MGALLAGVLSFFTPCILPMVPVYLSYMGGLSMAELHSDGAIAPGAQRRLIAHQLGKCIYIMDIGRFFCFQGLYRRPYQVR